MYHITAITTNKGTIIAWYLVLYFQYRLAVVKGHGMLAFKVRAANAATPAAPSTVRVEIQKIDAIVSVVPVCRPSPVTHPILLTIELPISIFLPKQH